jgi:uncharacterized membrane protein required for colicin V production
MFWGVRRGFLRSLFFLVGVIFGIYLGNISTKTFTKDISAKLNISTSIAGFIIFGISFFLVLSIVNGLGLLIRRPKKGIVKILDRLGGGVVGIVWGIGILGLLGVILSRFDFTKNLLPSTILLGLSEFWVRKIVERILSYGTWWY